MIVRAYDIHTRRIAEETSPQRWKWEVAFYGQDRFTTLMKLPDRRIRRSFETEEAAFAFAAKLRARNRSRRRAA